MKLTFDTRGNDKQKECVKAWADKETTEIVYGGSKGSAKSFTGCSLIFGDALMYPGTHYFIARKVLKDLRAFTIPSIYEVFDLWGLDKYLYLKHNGQDSFFQLPNESRVYLLDAKYIPSDPEFARFGSMQFTRGWIEEAGEFELVCKENLQASLGRKGNKEYDLTPKLLQTCNPAHNYLYDDYKKMKKGTLEPYKKFIQAFPQDNKMLGDQYIENLHRILSGARKERLLYGNWEYDDDPSRLIEFNKIQDLWTNSFVKGGQKYLSCDIALHGSDKFVIVVWDGWIIIDILTHAKTDGKEVIDAIQKAAFDYQVPNSNIIYDSDGLGGFVGGWVRNARAFKNGGSPIKTKDGVEYQNLKSQCYFEYAKKVQRNEVFIDCNKFQAEIIEEHEQIKNHAIDSDNKLRVLPKDKIKEIIGRSPDFTDAIMMRIFFDLKPNYSNFMSRG